MSTTTYPMAQTLLLQKRATLLAQLESLRGGAIGRAEASTAHFAGREDSSAQVATERDIEFALDAHETQELMAIDQALERLAAGTYGQCIDCGVAIKAGRLAVAPEAARCIHCQEKSELA
ncbi:TraR/DksA family transcriptional regulator [Rhodoferax aquaticus]|uniref:TraR/DksA family transcriptional regulator n=1 Tax=Rhodoferax aquaticus TaxID=2527691 RepID=A0A515EK10_9BURK|nr:TraR/DksA family transcriptional regulator [Rhodoferax aquaticus]QDL53002.1 TraR/DksA family transcriptional regulator [Rhodoferax aquaticus]